MKAKVEKIAAHGITCFVNRQLIYNYPESILSEKGIMSIEHADFEGVERLALVTGGEIASTFDQPDQVKIGRCDLIEEIMIGEDKVRCVSFENAKTLSNHLASTAHQILRSRRRRSMYRRPSRRYHTNGRRSRTITTRRALRSVADGQGDSNSLGRWLC